MSNPPTTGQRDGLGYLRWTPTACRRCGYEQVDCTCIGGFVAPQTTRRCGCPEPCDAFPDCGVAATHPEYLAGLKTGHADMSGEISLLKAVIRELEGQVKSRDQLLARYRLGRGVPKGQIAGSAENG